MKVIMNLKEYRVPLGNQEDAKEALTKLDSGSAELRASTAKFEEMIEQLKQQANHENK